MFCRKYNQLKSNRKTEIEYNAREKNNYFGRKDRTSVLLLKIGYLCKKIDGGMILLTIMMILN